MRGFYSGRRSLVLSSPQTGRKEALIEAAARPADRRYKTPILPPGLVPTAAVRLYLRAAPATAFLRLDIVPPPIAGGRLLYGFFLPELSPTPRSCLPLQTSSLPGGSSAALHNVVMRHVPEGVCEAHS